MQNIQEKDKLTSDLCRSSLLRIIPKECFQPSALIYYSDFTLSLVLYHLFFYACYKLMKEGYIYQAVVLAFITSFIFYRVMLFIHESVHQSQNLPNFVKYYNLVNGFPNKVPLYCYKPHLTHHDPKVYGQANDPEYQSISSGSIWFHYLLVPVIFQFPVAVFTCLRFNLVPFLLPFIGSKGREFIWRYASTLAMNPFFDRGLPTEQDKKEWYVQDFGCACATTCQFIAIYFGFIEDGLSFMRTTLIIVYFLLVVNMYRAMAAHRYFAEPHQPPLSRKQMILDSVNYASDSWICFFWFPVGTLYHGLHHVFPTIPYHHLARVHSILVEHLRRNDPSHPYLCTVIESYWENVRAQINLKL